MELIAPDTPPPPLVSNFDLGDIECFDIESESSFLGFLFTGSPLSLERWSELDPDLEADMRLDSRASLEPLPPLVDIVDM